MASPRTASDLLADARDRANREMDDPINGFVSDATGLRYLQAAANKLWGMLVQAYGTDYYWTSCPVTLQPGQPNGIGSYVDLPRDFFKLRGIDYVLNNGYAVALKPYTEHERNKYRSNPILVWWGTDYKYRIEGSQVHFIPSANGAIQIVLHYTPKCWFMGWGGAQAMKPAVAADGNGNLQFTQPNHLLRTGQALRCTPQPGLAGAALPGGLRSDTDVYAFVVDGDRFNVCASQANALGQGGVMPVPIPLNGVGTGQLQIDSVFDGVNGFEEYIVTDAAVRMLAKEESDTTELKQERAKVEEDLRMLAENRDAAFPGEVQDVQSIGGASASGSVYGG
jgi:hypothetical protein